MLFLEYMPTKFQISEKGKYFQKLSLRQASFWNQGLCLFVLNESSRTKQLWPRVKQKDAGIAPEAETNWKDKVTNGKYRSLEISLNIVIHLIWI